MNIAIFASGSGSNAENIISYFKKNNLTSNFSVFCNKANAGVFERAKRLKTPAYLFTKNDLISGKTLELLKSHQIDFIVLAGFLLQFPKEIISLYPNKIVNIHPALLPKYGGKGMYGMHVHNAVIQNKESETGITIHYVNENYDEGAIIFQAKTNLTPFDTPETVAEKIHSLEYAHFPKVIEQLLKPLL